MKLLLLHPLPLDGSIFSDDIRALGDAVAPTLYSTPSAMAQPSWSLDRSPAIARNPTSETQRRRSWPGPVWVVSGEHDINPARSRQLASRLPNATFNLVDDVGHYVPLEAPAALTALTARAIATGG